MTRHLTLDGASVNSELCSDHHCNGWTQAMNEHTAFILGRPNFVCAAIALRLRVLGHEITKCSEDEQVYVINWMLEYYEAFGDEWKERAGEYLWGDK